MTERAVFRGLGTAMATPFAEDGIDEGLLVARIAFQIAHGIDALILLGTTGEAASVTASERRRIVSAGARAIDGRVPMIVGTGSNCTREAVEMAHRAQDGGADALLVVTPHYNRPSQAGLLGHFFAIAEAATVPVILYNVPMRTGVNLRPETTAQLASHPRIVGLKEANPDLTQLAHTAALVDASFSLYIGNDEQIIPAMALGAAGAVSVASNLFPDDFRAIAALSLAQRFDEARAVQRKYLTLMALLSQETNPQPLKAAMEALGMDSGRLRLPLASVDSALNGRIREALAALT